jgi:hypothetical protein
VRAAESAAAAAAAAARGLGEPAAAPAAGLMLLAGSSKGLLLGLGLRLLLLLIPGLEPLLAGLLLGEGAAAAAAAAAAAVAAAAFAAAAAATGSTHVRLQMPQTCVLVSAGLAAGVASSWSSCTGGCLACRPAGTQPVRLGLLCRALWRVKRRSRGSKAGEWGQHMITE